MPASRQRQLLETPGDFGSDGIGDWDQRGRSARIPLRIFLPFMRDDRTGFYLILLLIPFWTSYLLRIMAWKILLGTEGVINSFLIYVGLIQEPLPALLYNRTAVLLTLIYVWIPFAALAHPCCPAAH